MTPRICLMMAACGCLLLSCSDKNAVQRANSADIGNSPTAPSLKTGSTAEEIQNTALPVTPSAQDFANSVAAGDELEIEVSKLALSNAQSAAVKAFAQAMVTAHTQSSAELRKAGASTAPSVTPDTTLTPEQQQILAQLRGKTGRVFDQQYVFVQRDAHQRTLGALKTYAAQGDQPPLNAFANRMIPVVSRHLAMARELRP